VLSHISACIISRTYISQNQVKIKTWENSLTSLVKEHSDPHTFCYRPTTQTNLLPGLTEFPYWVMDLHQRRDIWLNLTTETFIGHCANLGAQKRVKESHWSWEFLIYETNTVTHNPSATYQETWHRKSKVLYRLEFGDKTFHHSSMYSFTSKCNGK
jgi:hypothetical protein